MLWRLRAKILGLCTAAEMCIRDRGWLHDHCCLPELLTLLMGNVREYAGSFGPALLVTACLLYTSRCV